MLLWGGVKQCGKEIYSVTEYVYCDPNNDEKGEAEIQDEDKYSAEEFGQVAKPRAPLSTKNANKHGGRACDHCVEC